MAGAVVNRKWQKKVTVFWARERHLSKKLHSQLGLIDDSLPPIQEGKDVAHKIGLALLIPLRGKRSWVVGYTQNKTARFREPHLLAVGDEPISEVCKEH